MVTHPTRTPPKVYFISLLASSASPHCLVQMRTLCGEAPWRKQKKQKQYLATLWGEAPWRKSKKMKKNLENKKKQYLGTLWGEAPWRKPKKLKKPRENKKKQYLGTLGWTPLSTKTSGKLFFFFLFSSSFWFSNFLIPKTSGNCIFRFHGICPYLPVYVTSWSFAAFSLLYLICRRTWPSQLLLLRQLLSYRQPSDNHASHTLLHPSIHCEFYSS